MKTKFLTATRIGRYLVILTVLFSVGLTTWALFTGRTDPGTALVCILVVLGIAWTGWKL